MTTRVLVTGAAGRIGTLLCPRLHRPGRVLRLLDVAPVSGPEVVQASITDLPAMEAACEGVDAVIHLAGLSREHPWPEIVETNITGTYTVFEAARRQGVRRVIYASSLHAVGYVPVPDGGEVGDDEYPRPDTYYGVSKVAGEALGSLYADRYGMEVICVRIASFGARPETVRHLGSWLSPDDAGRLFEACLTAPCSGFRTVWGVSDNTRRWFALRAAEDLGYKPQDDAEAYAAEILDRGDPPPDNTHIGGNWSIREEPRR